MVWLAASIVIQIVCAVHVIRTGRNQIWMLFIFLFSIMGCFAYLMLEVLPGYWGNRYVRTARAHAAARIDPERQLRTARDQLALADTVANRIMLADALSDLGRYREALVAYDDALSRLPGDDWPIMFKRASVQFELGEFADAQKTLAAIPPSSVGSEEDRRNLLRARVAGELREDDVARRLFEDVVSRIPGEAARCHYAAFLIERGDRFRARQLLEDVEQRARRLDRYQKSAEADMYRWAGDQLQLLRAESA
jgi:hypothetical protein